MNFRFRVFAPLLLIFVGACDQQLPASVPPVDRAQRIVSLAPHLGELVFAAGAGDYLVGVSEFTDFPAAVTGLPRVGDAFRVDYEILASLSPDLILSWSSGNPRQVVERLKRLGYRVVSLEAETLEDVAAQLEVIGELAGTLPVARRTAMEYRQGLNDLRLAYAQRARISVFYQVSQQPLLTVNDRHLIGQVIRLCGGKNLFGEMPDKVPAVSPEAVLDQAPEVVLAGLYDADAAANLDYWRAWKALPAASHERIYGVNADFLSRPGPRLLAGARELCETLDRARN